MITAFTKKEDCDECNISELNESLFEEVDDFCEEFTDLLDSEE